MASAAAAAVASAAAAALAYFVGVLFWGLFCEGIGSSSAFVERVRPVVVGGHSRYIPGFPEVSAKASGMYRVSEP